MGRKKKVVENETLEQKSQRLWLEWAKAHAEFLYERYLEDKEDGCEGSFLEWVEDDDDVPCAVWDECVELEQQKQKEKKNEKEEEETNRKRHT
jgi:hypothetical protein